MKPLAATSLKPALRTGATLELVLTEKTCFRTVGSYTIHIITSSYHMAHKKSNDYQNHQPTNRPSRGIQKYAPLQREQAPRSGWLQVHLDLASLQNPHDLPSSFVISKGLRL